MIFRQARRSPRAAWLLALTCATLLTAGSSRAATAQSPHAVDVAHYQVLLVVDVDAGTVTADAMISIPAAAVRPEVVFILGGSRHVDVALSPGVAVSIQPTDVPWSGLQEIAVIPRRPDEPLTLRIRSRGTVALGGSPPINQVSPELVELSLDGMWLPLIRGFTSGFTADVEIRGLPEGMQLIGTGSVRREGTSWILQRSFPDFDLSLAATHSFTTVDGPGFSVTASDTASPTVQHLRVHGARALSYLENWFGPMPNKPVRVVVIRRERRSGYARRGYIVMTEGSRAGEVATAKFVAHEFAHAWWSPVDPNTEDRWLQESVAEYIALRYVEASLGAAPRDSIVQIKRTEAATATALLGLGARSDRELYHRGPLLLMELEHRIGRSVLDDVFRELALRPPGDTAAFLSALSRQAGAEAALWFEARLRSG